ncbi:unnamed protein product [Oikopleura dioica]|uniref:Uncharacterized protein n=1 Tax=Oikopleura dioica TaxID=34765 RepID=E4XQS2_OIKDI|nr:unnamed protein product [Oikopleura dioica]
MDREHSKKRDRSKAELNHDEFDIESPDRKTRAISDTALAYRDPVVFRGDETRFPSPPTHESTKLEYGAAFSTPVGEVQLCEGPDVTAAAPQSRELTTDETVYSLLPDPTKLRERAETTMAMLTALTSRDAQAHSFSDFRVRDDTVAFKTPQRNRADITKAINSIDGVFDCSEEASSTDSTASIRSSRRFACASTRFDRSYPLRDLPHELFPEFEAGLLDLYMRKRPQIPSALVHLRKRQFHNASDRENPFPDTRALLFYIGKTFRSSRVLLVLECKLELPPCFAFVSANISKTLAQSIVSLLQTYHVSLSEFYRGGCFCKARTNNHAERLQEMARQVLDLLYTEEMPNRVRIAYLAPISFPSQASKRLA